MEWAPVKKPRMYHDIVKQIKAAIKEKEILPGEKLPSERTLSETLSVSRTSVKEAFSVLESAGVVEIKQGSGVFLLKAPIDDILEKLNAVVQGLPLTLLN